MKSLVDTLKIMALLFIFIALVSVIFQPHTVTMLVFAVISAALLLLSKIIEIWSQR